MRLLLLSLSCILTLLAGSPAPAEKTVSRILCFGDSITDYGQWVETVGKHPRFETINAGKSGRKADGAKAKLAPYLEKHKNLDRVLLFLGVNDLPARDKRPGAVKVAGCVKNMSEAIDLALTRFEKRDVILVAPCGVNPDLMPDRVRKKGYDITQPLLQKLETDYQALARKKGVRFLSLLKVVSPKNFKDGLHPNEAGDAEIAAAVLLVLTQK